MNSAKNLKQLALAAVSLLAVLPAFTFVRAAYAVAKPGGVLAQRLLQRYEALKSYQGTVQSVTTLQPTNGSKPNVIRSTMEVEYEKPNLLHIMTEGLMGGGSVVSNGSTLYTYSALTNQYSERPAPRSLLGAFIMPLRSATDLHVVGQANIGGAAATEYAGTAGSGARATQYQLYVDKASGLIRRLVIHVPQLPGAEGAHFRMTVQQDYVSQKLNQQISASAFQFAPPAGAQKGPADATISIMGALGSQTP